MTSAVARYQKKLDRVNLFKDFWGRGLWTVDRGNRSQTSLRDLTRPGFFLCFKRREWSDGLRLSMKGLEIAKIIHVIDAFLPCRCDSTFFVIQRFLFNKSCTFFLPFFNCKNKEKRSLLGKLMNGFEATHTGMSFMWQLRLLI